MGYVWESQIKRKCPHCKKIISIELEHRDGSGGDNIIKIKPFKK